MLRTIPRAWFGFEPSRLSHHDDACCRHAKAWFLAMDHSHQLSGESPATWIRRRFDWGPSPWPLHWCETVRSEQLDCGALADLARESFINRGQDVLSCQAIQRFNSAAVRQWRTVWERAGFSPRWAHRDSAYHELCGVVQDDRIRLWDPTDNVWIDPSAKPGYGCLIALKLNIERATDYQSLSWGTLTLPLSAWVYVDTLGENC